MLPLVLADNLLRRRLHFGKPNQGYFMVVSFRIPEVLHIDPKNEGKKKNAQTSLIIAFAVIFSPRHAILYNMAQYSKNRI